MTGLSLNEFTKRMDQLATEVQRSSTDILKAAATRYTTAIRSELSTATNGGRLRNVGKRGARVGVSNKAIGSNAYLVYATGPEHLIERDTQKHEIPRATRTRRTRTAAGRFSYKRESTGRAVNNRVPLLINGTWVTGPVTHPGTKGKHPFQRGVDKAEQQAFVDAATELFKHMKSILGS